MKKQDKIGYSTGRVYDIETNQFAKQGNFLLIKKIDCYYSESEGVYGFFPTYEIPNYDEQIFAKEDCFYRDFKKTHKAVLEQRELTNNIKLIHNTINFARGECIKSFNAYYNEQSQKITAIKFRTNYKTYNLGKKGDLNNKEISYISKDDYFIPGFKTTYMLDKNVPHLSFLQVYFENESNFENYYKAKAPSRIKLFFRKKFNSAVNLLTSLSKFLLIAFIILFPFLFYYYKSQNLYGGEIIIPDTIQGLNHPVRIHTDSNGFTHIKADSDKDAYFGLGFTHAKERLWQMDFMRRTARGKLSEIFGMKTLPVDKLIRTLGLNEISLRFESFVRQNSTHLKELYSYVNGINYYANNFILPPEYHIFRASWSNWEIADTISLSNLMAVTLSHDWNIEVWYKIMEESLGREFAELVISFRDLNHPFWNETIVNDEELIQLNMHKEKKLKDEVEKNLSKEEELKRKVEEELRKATEEELKRRTEEEFKRLADEEARILAEEEEKRRKAETGKRIQGEAIKETTEISVDDETEVKQDEEDLLINPLHNQGASNSWVISGNHTSSGFPILSNDPHLTNGMPSLYFIAKFYLPDNTLTGATIPGLPFFMTGSNKYISWGFTTENSDTADICEEKIEEENTYIYENRKFRLSTNREVININGAMPETFDLKWTKNGPLITESFPKELLVVNFEFKPETPVSIRFAFFDFDFTSTDFFFALNKAKSSKDFVPEIDKMTTPNLNLVYASKDGEIGWYPLGKYPMKSYKNRFCRGYSAKDKIEKYISRVETPKLVNPSKGFIVTANNKPVSFNYTYQLHGFHNNVRAFRIRQMIEEKLFSLKKLTVEDSVEILKDVKDPLAEVMLPQILKIVERNQGKNLKNVRYYEDLKNWNHTLVKNSPMPTIWSALEMFIGKQLLTNKIADHKARGIMSMLHYWNFISGIIEKIYNGERVDLKQCAHLSGNINCEKYIVYIFSNIDKFLTELGLRDTNGRIYNWGQVKQNHYPHSPFDKIPVLNRIFSKTVSTGGNRNTVKIARGPFNHDKGNFVSTHSPRLKFVCDMSEPTRPHLIIDGGNSGNIISRFYNNLMQKHEDTQLIQMDDIDFDNLQIPSADTMILRNK